MSDILLALQSAFDDAAITLNDSISAIYCLVGGIGLLISLGLGMLRNRAYYRGTPRFVQWLPLPQRLITGLVVLVAVLWVAVRIRMSRIELLSGYSQISWQDNGAIIALGALLVIAAAGALIIGETRTAKLPV